MKHSHTETNNYVVCPSRYFHMYVARDIEQETTPAMEHGKRVHTAFEDALAKGRALPEDLQVFQSFVEGIIGACAVNSLNLAVELRVAVRANGQPCSFYADDRFWAGKVDVVLTNDSTALLFDWKTGSEREDSFELRQHALMLYAAAPNLQTIKGRYVWLKHNKLGEMHNLSNVQSTWAEMHVIAGRIKRSRETNYWPTQEGPLCKYCPVRQCRFNRSGAVTVGRSFAPS